MRILIFSGNGMLGHQCLKVLSQRHEVKVTLMREPAFYQSYGFFTADNSFYNVDVRNQGLISEVLSEYMPDVVINAAGIIKQNSRVKDTISCIEINALFPHRLSELCADIGARLITMSTDCVFDGAKGNYAESDLCDATDVYGRTKLLGELESPHCVTIRSSIIGLELARCKSLIEWYLSQTGTINGFTKAIYTGLTTLEMARLFEKIITEYKALYGLWHVASQPISKYELLSRLTDKLNRRDLVIEKNDSFARDMSLNGQRFEQETGYKTPSWDTMLTDLATQINERTAMAMDS